MSTVTANGIGKVKQATAIASATTSTLPSRATASIANSTSVQAMTVRDSKSLSVNTSSQAGKSSVSPSITGEKEAINDCELGVGSKQNSGSLNVSASESSQEAIVVALGTKPGVFNNVIEPKPINLGHDLSENIKLTKSVIESQPASISPVSSIDPIISVLPAVTATAAPVLPDQNKAASISPMLTLLATSSIQVQPSQPQQASNIISSNQHHQQQLQQPIFNPQRSNNNQSTTSNNNNNNNNNNISVYQSDLFNYSNNPTTSAPNSATNNTSNSSLSSGTSTPSATPSLANVVPVAAQRPNSNSSQNPFVNTRLTSQQPPNPLIQHHHLQQPNSYPFNQQQLQMQQQQQIDSAINPLASSFIPHSLTSNIHLQQSIHLQQQHVNSNNPIANLNNLQSLDFYNNTNTNNTNNSSSRNPLNPQQSSVFSEQQYDPSQYMQAAAVAAAAAAAAAAGQLPMHHLHHHHHHLPNHQQQQQQMQQFQSSQLIANAPNSAYHQQLPHGNTSVATNNIIGQNLLNASLNGSMNGNTNNQIQQQQQQQQQHLHHFNAAAHLNLWPAANATSGNILESSMYYNGIGNQSMNDPLINDPFAVSSNQSAYNATGNGAGSRAFQTSQQQHHLNQQQILSQQLNYQNQFQANSNSGSNNNNNNNANLYTGTANSSPSLLLREQQQQLLGSFINDYSTQSCGIVNGLKQQQPQQSANLGGTNLNAAPFIHQNLSSVNAAINGASPSSNDSISIPSQVHVNGLINEQHQNDMYQSSILQQQQQQISNNKNTIGANLLNNPFPLLSVNNSNSIKPVNTSDLASLSNNSGFVNGTIKSMNNANKLSGKSVSQTAGGASGQSVGSSSASSSSSSTTNSASSISNSNILSSAFNYSNYVLFPSDAFDLPPHQQQQFQQHQHQMQGNQQLQQQQQLQQHLQQQQQNSSYYPFEDVLANLKMF